jgi:hypothetical protein
MDPSTGLRTSIGHWIMIKTKANHGLRGLHRWRIAFGRQWENDFKGNHWDWNAMVENKLTDCIIQ